MTTPPLPDNEALRLQAVREYDLLDTPSEKDFDIITNLLASICDTPIALVTLLDSERNFLKSHFGIPFNESPRDISFCGHAIHENENLFVIEDARKDPRFTDNPLVKEQGAVFYAGMPLINPNGFPLGTLCVFDSKPRKLTTIQKKALKSLAYQVMNLFEERKKNKKLQHLQRVLEKRNEELKDIAGIVSHDMKMPLANIILTTDLLKTRFAEQLGEDGQKYLDYLKQSSFTLSDYINSLLAHYVSDGITSNPAESFDIHQLLEEIIDLLNINLDCELNFPETNVELSCNRAVLEQIFINLIGNSLKYNDKDKIVIDISCEVRDDHYQFAVSDNGIGIPEDNQKDIFNLFTTIGNVDRHGQKGHGIGLSTVKKLVIALGGVITVTSTPGEGSTFSFSVKK